MKRPVHTQQPGPSALAGWRQPLSELWTQFQAELRSLKARAQVEIDGPVGVPAVYRCARVFSPEVQTTILGSFTGHVVIRDGQTYDIPVYFPGPGVFVARNIEVNIYQKVMLPVGGSLSSYLGTCLARQLGTALASSSADDTAIRTTRFWGYGGVGSAAIISEDDDEDYVPALQFFWNMQDRKSGRMLSGDFLPQQVLQPMTNTRVISSNYFSVPAALLGYPLDGGRFYFDAPWLVERDGQLLFLFRPTTILAQSTTTYTAGERQEAIVQVELYGERYETLQDALRSGAMTRPVRAEEA